MAIRHIERHRSERIGWLRASVLGVAGAGAARSSVLLTGVAGLVAGAMSMAAGEYVSVGSQADTEEADLARERRELATQDESERAELAGIYVARGLEPALAKQVADQLMAHDALGAHARDELGITEIQRARPVQAAFASAASFSAGAAMPLLAVLLAPAGSFAVLVTGSSLVVLAVLGAVAARAGGAPVAIGSVRVTLWGALAMAVTYAIGTLFGAVG